MSQAGLGPIVMEMATLGESGLNVNDPEQRYTLKLTPGEFSGLQIVCMMHVGLKTNRGTITRLYQETAVRVELETLEQLCRVLQCGVGALLEYVPEPEGTQPGQTDIPA